MNSVEEILSRYTDLSEARIKNVTDAAAMGADEKTLVILCDAIRLCRKPTIVIEGHRFENLSRGRGWARMGRGDKVTWGERVDGGYLLTPGRWSIGATDGFSRKQSVDWTVKHVAVGSETWTVAS